jgi:hypothetical protein
MATPTTPPPQTDATTSFAAWLDDHRPLTPEEITDILKQIQSPGSLQGVAPAEAEPARALKPSAPAPTTKLLPIQQWAGPEGSFAALPPSIKTTDIKATTKFGQEFTDWLGKRDSLTAGEIKTLTSKISTLTKTVAAAQLAAAKPTVKPELIISRTPYPKWWRDLKTAAISLSDAGTQTIVATPSRFVIYVATIVLTVSDETNISFGFGVFGSSGSLDLGGADEPRGIVIAMGDSPAPCGQSGLTITSDGAGVAVGGFVTYYLEKG